MSKLRSVEELFEGRHFNREVIILCVRWYLRFKLSLRDLVEMMAERGLSMAHTTIMRWVQRYAPEFTGASRPSRRSCACSLERGAGGLTSARRSRERLLVLAICTTARARARRRCVPVFLAPFSIWNSYTRSVSTTALPHSANRRGSYVNVADNEITALFAGRGIRLGAYGDPAAVPARIWEAATARAAFWTGYTHQWRICDPIFARWCMASCETKVEREEARALGYRTFRTTWTNAWADRLEGENLQKSRLNTTDGVCWP
jgi:hypothetical protein